MRKAFKYRLYPTRQQAQIMEQTLETHRRLYNEALAERKATYEQEQRTVKYVEQSAQLKVARHASPFLAATNFSSCQATLRRLDRAFRAFFRRAKAGGKPGYPRFKGKHRFSTVEFPAYGDGCRLDGGLIYFQHVGSVKVKLHRPIEGKIKTVSFKREPDGWHGVFSCELPDVECSAACDAPVGIDLGLKAFLVTSDGQHVLPPHYYRKAQKRLRKAQRALSRCKRGSNRRKKAVQRVAQLHHHIANQRRDFHHKTALALVNTHSLIVHEDLNIKGIARSRLAKSAYDVGWAGFLNILRHKAEGAGVAVIAVPPRNTTQACSDCGCLVPKTLSDRVHSCPHCGYEADRDLNAARNILRLGRSRQALTWPTGASVA